MTNQMTTLTLNKAEVCYLLNALSVSKQEFSHMLNDKSFIKDEECIKVVINNTDKLISKIETASGVSSEII